MRATDQAVPVVTGPRPGPGTPMGAWPAQLYVAVEKVAATFPRWDDMAADWDGAEAGEVWDATGAGTSSYVDAICSLHGLTITSGEPDGDGIVRAGRLAMTLDNRSGQWSQYDTFGRLVDYMPGRRIAIWARLAGADWWLWAGHVTSWAEHGSRIEVEGWDAFTRLNQAVGEFTPGTAGQTVAQRIAAILALVSAPDPTRLAAGDITCLAPDTDRTPLEEMQRTAQSDGGILAMDADGTLVYRDRRWRAGRPDQVSIPVVSGNVCTAPAIVWDPVFSTDDAALINWIRLANVEEPAPVVVTGQNDASIAAYGRHAPDRQRDGDLWQSIAQGQALADYLVAEQGDAYLRVAELTLYLNDPGQDLWALGVDRRLGDLIELIQDVPAADAAPIPPEPPPTWNEYVTGLAPWSWLKLDDGPNTLVAVDASGNGRPGSYLNGTFGGGDLYPNFNTAPLVTGSTYGITCGGGGNDELYGTGWGNAMSGSWTIGMAMKIPATPQVANPLIRASSDTRFSVHFNTNTVGVATYGAVVLVFDNTGAGANALQAATTWNDGAAHLLFYEYDATADTISIFFDGIRVATRARAGTKPTMTGQDIRLVRANPYTGLSLDEAMVFNRVLTDAEHLTLAGYRVGALELEGPTLRDEPPPVRRLDLFLALQSIRHDITPDGWICTWGTTRPVRFRTTYQWDASPYTWDNPAAANVWSH